MENKHVIKPSAINAKIEAVQEVSRVNATTN